MILLTVFSVVAIIIIMFSNLEYGFTPAQLIGIFVAGIIGGFAFYYEINSLDRKYYSLSHIMTITEHQAFNNITFSKPVEVEVWKGEHKFCAFNDDKYVVLIKD